MPLTFWSRVSKARLIRVLFVYLASSWLLLQVTSLFIQSFDLPKWFMPAAVLLLLIGLVIITATAWVQSHPSIAARAEAEEIPGSWEIDLGDMKHSVARGRLPHLTWARSLLGGVFAFSLLFGLAGLYVMIQDRGHTLTPQEAVAGSAAPGIAVLPFSVRGTGLDVWREGMVDVLSTNLDGVAGLRAIDSRTVLARWREQVPANEAPDLNTSLEVARRAGARYALVGNALATGPQIRFAADIYDLDTRRALGKSDVVGPADSVLSLVNRLSIEVLRAIARGEPGEVSHVDLARVTTSSLPALKAYLEGEVLFRRSDFTGAIAAYQRAVSADSTFALALYRLSLSHGWSEGILSDLPAAFNERAARFADRLPARDRVLVQANLALNRGTLDGLEPLRQIVRRYPDDAEAWYLLGDTYFHLGPALLVEREESDRAFSRATALDPSFSPAYIHPIENAFAAHNQGVAPVVQRFARISPGGIEDRANKIAFPLVFGDESSRERASAALDTVPAEVLERVRSRLRGPALLSVGERVQQVLRRRADADEDDVILLFLFQARQGKLRVALEQLRDPLIPTGFRFAALYWAVTQDLPVPQERLERALSAAEPDDYVVLFFAGAVAADRARWDEYAAARAQLREAALQSYSEGDSAAARFAEGASLALDGYARWRRNNRAEAAAILDQARLQAVGYAGREDVNEIIRWWLGQLMLELRRPREAATYFRSLSRHSLAEFYLGKSYEELGEFMKARESYELFVLGWKDADPELQPMVVEARAAVQRLSSAIQE